MKFQYNDGGRAEAGYKGHVGDCGCRAVAIVTGRPYKEVYDELNCIAATERISKRKKYKSSARNGFFMDTMKKYMGSLGWKWKATMTIGSGCKVHMKADELPSGKIMVRLSKHYSTVIDGVLNDTYDCSRDGTRCVYGYWYKE